MFVFITMPERSLPKKIEAEYTELRKSSYERAEELHGRILDRLSGSASTVEWEDLNFTKNDLDEALRRVALNEAVDKLREAVESKRCDQASRAYHTAYERIQEFHLENVVDKLPAFKRMIALCQQVTF
jgi:ribosomal protein S20